jgi:hypothetical protein
MQSTKLLLVVANDLATALNQLNSILVEQFTNVDCKIQNLFCVPEARQTRVQTQMQIVCNLVCVLVSDDVNVIWPGSEQHIEKKNEESMKALATFNKAIKE